MNRVLRILAALIALTLSPAANAHNGVDDEPHHGGVVKAYQDMHYEAVLVPGGGVQVYFSDAMGEPLPASAVSQMAVEIERPGQKTEYIDMAIDPTGVFWTGKSGAVVDPKGVVRIGFMMRGRSALVEVPVAPLLTAQKRAGQKAAGAGHHGH